VRGQGRDLIDEIVITLSVRDEEVALFLEELFGKGPNPLATHSAIIKTPMTHCGN
jgi:hypothetical protein